MRIVAPVYKTKIFLADMLCSFKHLPTSSEIQVPYFSQIMSPELMEDFIDGERELRTDPEWKLSGAETPIEYEQWAWNNCGIACLKMILAAKDSSASSLPLMVLAKEATKYGAFKVTDTLISPLHYAEFCTFVREKYSLHAHPVSALSFCILKKQITKGNFVIASVNSNVRCHTNPTPCKRGGHLVLIVAFDKRGLYIHNPDGYQSNLSQERAFVPYDDFKRFFAYRGIVIENK